MTAAAADLVPADLSLETYNSQYLQKHSTSPRAILASAQALHILGAPAEEVESTTFGVLNPEVERDIRVSSRVLHRSCRLTKYILVRNGSSGVPEEYKIHTIRGVQDSLRRKV